MKPGQFVQAIDDIRIRYGDTVPAGTLGIVTYCDRGLAHVAFEGFGVQARLVDVDKLRPVDVAPVYRVPVEPLAVRA